jgi:hypothetical protein
MSAPENFIGAGRRIGSPSPWLRRAALLEVPAANLLAIGEVESRGAAFMPSGRPPILFERHVFHRRTAGRFDLRAPDLSDRTPGGYGPGGEAQYLRLVRAIKLDAAAALESASWGRFQIMGFNAGLCGWPDVEAFVGAICEDEREQLRALVRFLEAARIVSHLRVADWREVAARYNGPAYAAHGYHTRLATAAQAWTQVLAGRLSGAAAHQRALAFLGLDPGAADGAWGRRSIAAAAAFARREGLDGLALTPSPRLTEALTAAVRAAQQEK